MTYEALSTFAQRGGSIYFALMFAVAVIYAFWPKNKDTFSKAANAPLEDGNDDAPIV